MIARWWAVAAFAVVLIAFLPTDCAGRTCNNDEFGISVEIPDHYHVCTSEPPMADRGFAIALAGSACQDVAAPSVMFSLSHNASLEHRTTSGIAQAWCRPAAARRSAIRVGGVPMMLCARPGASGLDQRLYIGLRQEAGKWYGQWTVVAIFVRCRMAAMADCAAVVEGLARRLRWHE